MSPKVFDLIGVGFGPGNIALAIALKELYPEISAHFVESDRETRWQHNMMIANADIQHSPFMDFVTPRNPQSYFSFMNYLHQNERLFKFFNLGLEFPLRLEYADYIKWAAEHFANQVDYGTHALEINVSTLPGTAIPCYQVHTSNGHVYQGKSLVLATGRTPNIPENFAHVNREKLVHVSQYKSRLQELGPSIGSVAVIGASQSAVEILLDLTENYGHLNVTNYIRHFGYRQKDLSPQMEKSIYPEHVENHFNRTWEQRHHFNEDLKYQNYSSADMDVLKEINLRSYIHELENGVPLYEIINNSTITEVSSGAGSDPISIASKDRYTGDVRTQNFDAVILATGFKDLGPREGQERIHPLLEPIADRYEFDSEGVVRVGLNYTMYPTDTSSTPPVFLNGLCEGTHGVSDAGSFSLLALRSQKIASTLNERLPVPSVLRREKVLAN